MFTSLSAGAEGLAPRCLSAGCVPTWGLVCSRRMRAAGTPNSCLFNALLGRDPLICDDSAKRFQRSSSGPGVPSRSRNATFPLLGRQGAPLLEEPRDRDRAPPPTSENPPLPGSSSTSRTPPPAMAAGGPGTSARPPTSRTATWRPRGVASGGPRRIDLALTGATGEIVLHSVGLEVTRASCRAGGREVGAFLELCARFRVEHDHAVLDALALVPRDAPREPGGAGSHLGTGARALGRGAREGDGRARHPPPNRGSTPGSGPGPERADADGPLPRRMRAPPWA
jgi:hypothetical protein